MTYLCAARRGRRRPTRSASSPVLCSRMLAAGNDDQRPAPEAAASRSSRRRRRGKQQHRGAADDGEAAAVGEEDVVEVKKEGKKRSIPKLLTWLAALEAEEHADRAGAADASRRELALLESNSDTRSQAMMDYYAKMESSFDATAESEAAARSKRSRLAASAAVVAGEEAAAAAASSASGSPTRAAGPGQGHHQRRLWVKDRSRAWWDRRNSADYPEEEFRRAFRMGQETFDMICDASVAKEDTMLRALIPVRQC